MRNRSRLPVFAAGFVAGGIVLGAVFAQAGARFVNGTTMYLTAGAEVVIYCEGSENMPLSMLRAVSALVTRPNQGVDRYVNGVARRIGFSEGAKVTCPT